MFHCFQCYVMSFDKMSAKGFYLGATRPLMSQPCSSQSSFTHGSISPPWLWFDFIWFLWVAIFVCDNSVFMHSPNMPASPSYYSWSSFLSHWFLPWFDFSLSSSLLIWSCQLPVVRIMLIQSLSNTSSLFFMFGVNVHDFASYCDISPTLSIHRTELTIRSRFI